MTPQTGAMLDLNTKAKVTESSDKVDSNKQSQQTFNGEKTSSVWPYTGCPRRNVPDFGRVFLILKYTDITQNTYVLS